MKEEDYGFLIVSPLYLHHMLQGAIQLSNQTSSGSGTTEWDTLTMKV